MSHLPPYLVPLPSDRINSMTSGNQRETKNSFLGSKDTGRREWVGASWGLVKSVHLSGHKACAAEATVNTSRGGEHGCGLSAVGLGPFSCPGLEMGPFLPTEGSCQLPPPPTYCLVASSPGPGSGVLYPGQAVSPFSASPAREG